MTTELMLYKFKDTGVEVSIRKVSPLLGAEIQRAFPAPTPPLQEVDYGDGVKKMEPNPSDPTFIEELRKYSNFLEEKTRSLIIKRGVVIELTDEQKSDVAELRKQWKDDFGVELQGDDKYIFVSYIAVGTDSDLEELLQAILRRSRPTEGAIAEATKTFQG
jgi:hypothetical protein